MRETDSRVATLFTAGLSVAGIVAVAMIPQFPELIVVLGVVASALWLAALYVWIRNRSSGTSKPPPARSQTITGDSNVQIAGHGNVVTSAPHRADLTPQRTALNACISAGLAIQAEIDGISAEDLFRGYDRTYRPKVMAWHAEASAIVEQHYPAVRGIYSAEAGLPERLVNRLQVGFTKNTIRDIYAEVRGFLRSRISELRTLLNWREE